MRLTVIPAFTDNYIWVLYDDKGRCIIVDPGTARPVLDTIEQHQWQPQAILLTHHHQDHVGGVDELRQHFADILVYGPQETQYAGATVVVGDGDNITLGDQHIRVIGTPGHTLGHVVYYTAPWLFSGDTLFSAGCGRLFEGTAQQMYDALQRINQLPASTLLCCGHEYTLNNLQFATAIMTENKAISCCLHETRRLVSKKGITLPTKLAHERQINLFLMTHHTDLQRILGFNSPPAFSWEVLAELRRKKDLF